jgi:glutamine amidotransferase
VGVVAIVDYGMGNLDSVARAVEECGGRPRVTHDEDEIGTAAAVILPGVGAFARGMASIRERGLDAVLRDGVAERGVPLLGLCLGMHLLAGRGTEGGETEGLDLIPGEVRRFAPGDPSLRVPHVGWNEVEVVRPSPLFAGLPSGKDFYFVHSFHFAPEDARDVVATTRYGGEFVSVVQRENVFGVQFHPEKSQRTGFALLRNFLDHALQARPAVSVAPA